MIIDKNLYNRILYNYKEFILSFYLINILAIFVKLLIFFLIYNDFDKIDIIFNTIIFSFTISIFLLTLFLNIYIILFHRNQIFLNEEFNITLYVIYLNYILRIVKFGIFKNLSIIIYSTIHLYKNETKSLNTFSIISIFISFWIGLFSYMYVNVIKELIFNLLSCIELEKLYFKEEFELTNITIDNCSICLNDINNNKNYYNEFDNEKRERLLKEDKIVTLKKCNHSFHKECITKWLSIKNTCPNCRENIF